MGSVWGRSAIGLGSIWSLFGSGLGSVRGSFGEVFGRKIMIQTYVYYGIKSGVLTRCLEFGFLFGRFVWDFWQ